MASEHEKYQEEINRTAEESLDRAIRLANDKNAELWADNQKLRTENEHLKNEGDYRALDLVLCNDKLACANATIAAAEKRIAELEPFEAAVKKAHNGYDEEARKQLPELKEPATPADAIRSLLEEAESLEMMAIDRALAAEKRVGELEEALREISIAELSMTSSIGWGGFAGHLQSLASKALTKGSET